MKVGIFGGTFSPPHLGHWTAARSAIDALGLDKLLVIPAAMPPHKALPEDAPSPEHRLAMAGKLADALPDGIAEVSSIELDRSGKSYTVDTLTALREQYPKDELWILMGTDMFLTLHQWRDPAMIFQLTGVCAFGRAEQDGIAKFEPQRRRLEEQFPGARIAVITLPGLVEISSTQLRALFPDREEEAKKYLLPQIYGYILREELYGTKTDLRSLDRPRLRAVAYSMIRAKRIPHIQGTEEEAARLAQRWAADEDLVCRAAILHDCTKYLSWAQHLTLCAQYGVVLDEIEQTAEKLLHAKTGAALARHMFGESEQVCSAICYHTTGKANMSLVEKILYIADYIEPTRNFSGVEELRRLAYENLDEAIMLGCEMTIGEQREKHREVHPNTLAALEFLKGLKA